MSNIKVQLTSAKTKPKQTPKYAYIILKMKTKEKFIRRELTKMITNFMPGMPILSLHLVTKIRDSETHETRKFHCLSNLRHAKHLSGIETLKTD